MERGPRQGGRGDPEPEPGTLVSALLFYADNTLRVMARRRYRLAAENPAKADVLRALLDRHQDDRVLVIGQYLDQIRTVARDFGLPLLTGQSSNAARESLYRSFREGRVMRLAVSNIANVALDLPEANCAIQISGRFGSRQEEAQRLGRVLRPKRGANKAFFYTLVSQDTEEQYFARHPQLFLAEQGYRYMILSAEAACDPAWFPPSACREAGAVPPAPAALPAPDPGAVLALPTGGAAPASRPDDLVLTGADALGSETLH